MATVVLVPGPPAGIAMWQAAEDRLRSLGHRVECIDLIDLIASSPAAAGRGAQAAVDRAASALDDALPPEAVVVAHGVAIPVALRSQAALRLVLSNGPLGKGPLGGLDPVHRALAATGPLLGPALLRAPVLQRWLASSAGLRRTVVNPYVMDRDTVVAIYGAHAERVDHRVASAQFIRDLPRAVEHNPPARVPALAAWGDADALYPVPHLAHPSQGGGTIDLVPLPGARFYHPVERPWALADLVHLWLQQPGA